VKRRSFITLLGGAAAWPLAARAEPAVPVIGWLGSRSASESAALVDAFRSGLKEIGYVDGRNVAFAFRWADGQYDRLPAQAAELVSQHVSIIVATGGDPAAQAAKGATKTIPIVFVSGSDPVKVGLVASLNRPGGNITGIHVLLLGLGAKRLALLHELMPSAGAIGVLVNPQFPGAEAYLGDLREAAGSLGVQLRVRQAATEQEIEAAFSVLAEQRPGAVLIAPDPFFTVRRVQVVTAAARHGLPAMYELRDFAVVGGLISYGTSLADGYRKTGIYAGKVLKGVNPAELPIEQSTKFELVINLKTARTLGITVPQTLLVAADEVIE